MHFNNVRWALFFIVCITLLLTGCGAEESAESSGAAEPTPTSTPNLLATESAEQVAGPTITPEPSPTAPVTGDASEGGGSAGTGGSDPDSEPLTGTDGQELDSCLVGTWAVDPESMAAYLMTAMNQGGEQLFTVDSIEGDLFMTFTSSGEMSMNSNDYRLKILFSTAGLNFEMNMVLDAAGTATYTADGANISNWNRNYVSSGNPLEALLSAVSGSGSEIVFAVTPDWFTAGIVEIDGDEPSEATYMCEGDTLSLQPTEYGPVLFNRVD